MDQSIAFKAIGVIHSGHTVPEETPIQPCYAPEAEGLVEVFPEYAEGLRDIEGYSHIYLIYQHHKAGPAKLITRSCLQKVERGVFSTRVPARPNPIGLSIVKLLSREGNMLRVGGIDVLDGAPLLDIKPYSRRIDCVLGTKDGWQEEVDDSTAMELGRKGGLVDNAQG